MLSIHKKKIQAHHRNQTVNTSKNLLPLGNWIGTKHGEKTLLNVSFSKHVL